MISRWPQLVCAIVLAVMAAVVRAEPLEGKLVIVGSDTLAPLMTLWSTGFSSRHPQVSVELQAGGSAAAPTALLRGTANVGSMSRRMTEAEKRRFSGALGFEPLEIPLATDTIAVIVNAENPLTTIDIRSIAAAFGSTTCSGGGTLKTWGDLGLSGVWGNRPIEPFGRTAASGTYDFFRDTVLCGSDPGLNVGELPGGAAVIDTVASVPGAIGYTGAGFVDTRVRAVDVRLDEGVVVGLNDFQQKQAYPLNRLLYIYFSLTSDRRLPTMECEFLRYIHSNEGRQLLRQAGFRPAAAPILQQIPGCAM